MDNQFQAPFAVGLIETQGFTAVFAAIDEALKTAAVRCWLAKSWAAAT